MMFNLSGHSILVTGASSGIGKGTCSALSAQGATIILSGRNEEKLRETKTDLKNNNHEIISADLKDIQDIKALAKNVQPLDGIVFNAGWVKTRPLRFMNDGDLENTFEVNILSSIRLLRELLKKKKLNSGASVCFVSSIASFKPTRGNAMYAASKGAVNSFCKATALELAPKGIRVNAVLPGMIETSILDNSSISEDQLNEHKKNYPLGRFGSVKDVASLLVYLMASESSWMTGSLIKLDGGFTLK